jgi:(R)-2-hydroxyacyl-CoA dehydratese activating ATPase
MITCGIDLGSVSTEALILKKNPNENSILSYIIIPTGSDTKEASSRCFRLALEKAALVQSNIDAVVATGYGRVNVSFADKNITEISCHARGVLENFNDVRTIIDIGGQDCKVIRVDETNRPVDFLMNDKCAAGTGRFLEVMAKVLEIDISHFGKIFLSTDESVDITSTCTVFAESEIVSLIGHGVGKNIIIKGLIYSIADRINSMVERIGLEVPVCLTGGVAKNAGVKKAIEEKLGATLKLPDEPQITGALGAAILAQDL